LISMGRMRVLVACEESQEVCKAFRKLGHEAFSCDILPCSGGHPEWHIQRDVLKHTVSHIDFYQVNMKNKLITEIPLNYIGESIAVKKLNAILIKDFDSVEVSCLPSDLVDHIDVDITSLKEFDDAIRLEDLNLPRGIEFETEYLDTLLFQLENQK